MIHNQIGFSGFMIDGIQVTLVDCPGHASLIKTIIGASHIIDFYLLVIDATKGIQTQTAEVRKRKKIFVSNIFYSFFFSFSFELVFSHC